jgi:hypothetical protein
MVWLFIFPTASNAQTGTPRVAQAPVPPNVMPKPNPDQPYVYRKVNDNFYIVAEIHQPYPKNEVNNPVHTQTMGFVIGTRRAAIIDTIINGHQWQPMNRYDIQEERELAQGILDGTIKGVPDPVLKTTIYYLRWKRISMRE